MQMEKKETTKTSIMNITFLAIFGFFLAFCSEPPEKKVTGTVTADADGTISFRYSRTNASRPDYCSFTTNLPSPNDQFVITIPSGESTGLKDIDGLTAGQNVTWTAIVDGKPLNHGSGNFVHIIND